MRKICAPAIRISSNFFAAMIMVLLFSSFLQAAEYVSLYAYYGRPFYTYGSGDITCDEGLLNDERYQSCEERVDRNKYFYTLTGYKEIHDLTDSRVICQRDESLGGCTPDSSVSFSLSYPMGTRRLPAAFRLYIPPGTLRVNLSIKMNNSSADGIVLRYQNTPDCLGWPYRNYDAVPWTENANAGLEEMKAGDVYKPNPGGSIFAVPITSFSAPLDESGAGWLYVRDLGLDSSEIRTVTFNVTVNSAVYLDWYNRMERQQDWDVNGDPWSPNHEIVNTSPPPGYTPPPPSNDTSSSGSTPSSSYTTPPSGGGSSLNEGPLSLFFGVPPSSGSTSTPASSSSTESSGSTNTFGFPAIFSFNGQPLVDENPPCDQNHLEGCDKAACEALGNGHWYDGSCHEQREFPVYDDHIAEAPVRLGSDVDDGELVAGDGLSLRMNFSGEARRYVVIVFPNDDFYFIRDDNPEQLFTKQVVSLRNNGGEPLLEVADLCSLLPEYQGEWKIYFLTVPAVENEFQDLQALASYLSVPNAQYVLGSYSITVDCNRRNNVSATTLLGLFQ